MGNARMGAKTDIMHNVWTGCMDNAWTGATTDVTHDVQTGCTDNAWTGAPKGITYDVLTEFHQPLQVQSHLEMPGILVQLGHIQCT